MKTPDTTPTGVLATPLDPAELIVGGDHLVSTFLEFSGSANAAALPEIAGAIASLLAFTGAEYGREAIDAVLIEARERLGAMEQLTTTKHRDVAQHALMASAQRRPTAF